VVSNFGYSGSRDGRLLRGDIEAGGEAGVVVRRRQSATCVGGRFVGLPGYLRQRAGAGHNAETRGVAVVGEAGERASLKLVSWLCGEAEEATDDDERRNGLAGGWVIRSDVDGEQQ
jgi:hypothetical protein